MILNLIWIHLIVVLIFLSGFIDSVDEAISKRFRFHHLPKPFSCCLCSTFWASVIYLLFTKEFTLLTLLYALASATLTEVTTPPDERTMGERPAKDPRHTFGRKDLVGCSSD